MTKIGEGGPSPDEAGPDRIPRPLRILVAEDERGTVLTLTMLLRAEGYEVRTASTGSEALAAVADFDPDAVLLDIALPEMSGWQVARQVRERYGERPMLIGISGEYVKGVDRIVSKMLGLDHYLLKPYAPQALFPLLAPLKLLRPGAR